MTDFNRIFTISRTDLPGAENVFICNNTAYVAGERCLYAVDIINPKHPVLDYTLQTRYYSSSFKIIPAPGDLLLLVQSSPYDGMWITDAVTGEGVFDDLIFPGPDDAALHGNLLFAVNRHVLAIIDISNTENPRIIGLLKLDDNISSISIHNNRIYLMSYHGIRIFDLPVIDR